MIRKEKGQAMTELVIMLPVFLLIFLGMCQFSLISISRIKLAMIEREVMRYLAGDGEDMSRLNVFVNELSVKMGFENGSVSVKGQEKSDTSAAEFDNMKLGVGNKFTGIKFRVVYRQKLLRMFSAITGKEYLTLSTGLFTAAGGSFKLSLRETAEKIFNNIKGGQE